MTYKKYRIHGWPDYSGNREMEGFVLPAGSLKEELKRRNIQPESVGLPKMVGGC